MKNGNDTREKGRGEIWFDLLAGDFTQRTGQCPSVKVADGELDGYPVRAIAVIPDPDNRYPRAAKGEVRPARRLDAGQDGRRSGTGRQGQG